MSLSPRRRAVLIHLALVLSLLGAGGYWLFQQYEWVSYRVDTGFQGEAQRNPLLAAERLLARMGVPVHSLTSLPVSGQTRFGPADVVVLWQERASLRPLQAEYLLRWVEAGGFLVMSSQNYLYADDEPTELDPILDALGVHQHLNQAEGEEASATEILAVNWAGNTLRVEFSSSYYLVSEHPPLRRIDGATGAHLLQYAYGQGRVLLLSDLLWVQNDSLDRHDHAEFFWQLLNTPQAAPQVWLVRPEEGGLPLWGLLWEAFWPLLSAAGVLLGLWLWRSSQRFGPLLPPPSPRRRRLLEHVEASGQFLWQHQAAGALLSGSSERVWERLERVHPDWMHLPQTELMQRLAELSGVSAAEIQRALHTSRLPAGQIDSAEFTHCIQIFVELRKAL